MIVFATVDYFTKDFKVYRKCRKGEVPAEDVERICKGAKREFITSIFVLILGLVLVAVYGIDRIASKKFAWEFSFTKLFAFH